LRDSERKQKTKQKHKEVLLKISIQTKKSSYSLWELVVQSKSHKEEALIQNQHKSLVWVKGDYQPMIFKLLLLSL